MEFDVVTRAIKGIVFGLGAGAALAGIVAVGSPASGQAVSEAAPIFGIWIPRDYRDWRLISVAREEGKLPFPDGTIIARLAWSYVASEENNKAFGRRQSFVAGAPKNGVQFMVKDLKKYDSTGG